MADMLGLTNDSPYGFCPRCGVKGKSRERHPNGHDHCFSGHRYPSREALAQRPTDLATLLRHRIQRWEDSRTDLARDGNDSGYNDGYICALAEVADECRFILRESSDDSRIGVLEREVRRLNNAIRHQRERDGTTEPQNREKTDAAISDRRTTDAV